MLTVGFGYTKESKSLTFRFPYRFTIKDIPKDAKEIKFWIPYLSEDRYQSILKVDIKVPGRYKINKDEKYNNKIIFGTYKNNGESVLTGTIIYDIKRLERLNQPTHTSYQAQDPYSRDFTKYLQPSKFATISPRVKELARKITNGKTNTLSKVRSIYDYVFENMEYNKAVPGWGFGDTERACDLRVGNCTDFHSLFNSLVKATNIPAKFVIGFNIPDKKQSEVGGYHCWAEFYANELGWIPVDVSEAWKNKSKHEYYFGNLDKNRVQFTVGRDVVLNPPQNGEPLNYFIYPYVEIDGKVHYGVETSFKSELL